MTVSPMARRNFAKHTERLDKFDERQLKDTSGLQQALAAANKSSSDSFRKVHTSHGLQLQSMWENAAAAVS